MIAKVMAEYQPEVWVSDLFNAQKTNSAIAWQVCLVHQLRDCQYGIDAGDHIFFGRIKKLLLRAFVLRRRCSDLADSTSYQYRCRLYRDLDNILALLPTQEDGLRFQKRYRELRENLFLFLDDHTMIQPITLANRLCVGVSFLEKLRIGFAPFWGVIYWWRFVPLSILEKDKDFLLLSPF